MNELVFNMIYLLSNIFSVFFIEKFMSIFFGCRKSKLFFITAYASYPIITSIVYWLFDIPIVNLLCNVLCLFLITLSYKATFKKRIISVCFIYAFMAVTEALIAGLTGYFHISILERGSYSVVIGLVIVRLLLYFESILAQNLKNVKKNNPVSGALWISSFLIPFMSVYLILVIYSGYSISQANIVISTAIIFLINALAFYLNDALSAAYNDKINAMVFKREKDFYYNQCDIMQSTTDDLRAFRHDIKNHLMALNSFLEMNETKKGKEYLKDLIGDIESNVVYSSTGNIAFDSIINYKLRNAKDNGIDVNVDIKIPKELEINVVDTTVIIANLLDNALNALLNVEARKLSLKIKYSKGRIFIHIENTFNGYIRYEKGEIVTTNKNKEAHGYGLRNVRNAVEKYNGVLKISHTETLFKTDALLYLNE